MKIEYRKLDLIKPYDKNPRLNDAAVDAVAESLKVFGFRKPIVVDKKGVIICGHTCLRAAYQIGLKQAPVHVARELSPDQVRALRIADNKTAELADWDWDKLAVELGELNAAEFDLKPFGFTANDLAELLDGDVAAGLTDPDEVPAPPDEAMTQRGDLWILGEHRLLCGDSSSRDDVDRLVDGARIQLVNSDPPYNVKVEPRSNNAIAAGLSSFTGGTHHQGFDAARKSKVAATSKQLRAKDRPLANDFVSDSQFDRMLAAWFGNMARVLEAGRAFYIWGGFSNIANYPAPLRAAGMYFSQAIIWVKNQPVLTRKDFMTAHEWCFYGWREGKGHVFLGPKNVRDVWEVKKVPQREMVHLTEKPTELAVRAMQYSSRPNDRVLDLFGGSGSTLIAAEQTKRRACLMELDPLYCDVIVRRWEQFTGGKAKRVSVAATRLKRSAAAKPRQRRAA